VLLVSGQHDVFAPAAATGAWASALPNAMFVEIPGGYHDIVNDVAHRQVAEIICAFIESTTGA
jgi:pimeloyl-ACP methyl ester carboxylesterase